jgi:hypothetical protein
MKFQVVKTEAKHENDTSNFYVVNNQQLMSDVDFLNLHQQQQQQQQQQNIQLQLVNLNVPSPTSANPVGDSWPGDLNFKVAFQKLAVNTKNKSWDVSCI